MSTCPDCQLDLSAPGALDAHMREVAKLGPQSFFERADLPNNRGKAWKPAVVR